MTTPVPAPGHLRVLVVDDDRSIRNYLETALAAYGYEVFLAATGAEALAQAVETSPDLVILDLGLPDQDGKEIIGRLRRRSAIPIIILSVRDELEEKVAALDAGADDYLTKPFTTDELLARLRSVMRRLQRREKDDALRAGRITMDVTRRRVTTGSREVSLSPTEYEMLKMFLLNAGKVLTHQQLLRAIWDKDESYEGILHLLRVTISNLRGKVEPNPDRPTHILTEPGIGYRLRTDE